MRCRGAIGLFGLGEVLAGAEAPKGQTIPNLRPGPLLFDKNPDFVWGLIASQYIANVVLLIMPPIAAVLTVAALAAVGVPMVRAILAWRHDAASALR